jgi:hypothetical protein
MDFDRCGGGEENLKKLFLDLWKKQDGRRWQSAQKVCALFCFHRRIDYLGQGIYPKGTGGEN